MLSPTSHKPTTSDPAMIAWSRGHSAHPSEVARQSDPAGTASSRVGLRKAVGTTIPDRCEDIPRPASQRMIQWSELPARFEHPALASGTSVSGSAKTQLTAIAYA